ncbi:hypothetical protein [Candidatus Protochlamydia phocaeensis]|uniref:hypothetical protein n=1 Tax=Candidatus Protochlamydia phocaeensis TaxID=1414722 RepID=UPI000837F28F|nr:hypothetical protein [Candidatus Protochlamydia phocaeensis]
MICPLCPSAGFIGGIIGGYLGVNPPQSVGGRYLSILATANLVSLTVIALKALANISMCNGPLLTLTNISIVLAKTLVMGVAYSIAVNYLLNRFVFNTRAAVLPQVVSAPPPQREASTPSGCCHCQCANRQPESTRN